MDNLQPGDPARVGSYRVIARLGAGGMGRVFLGVSPGGRQVAIKLINPEYASSAEYRERFAREIDAARRVGGFHAAQVVDADPAAELPWMVTSYVEGPTLSEEVRRHGPLPADRARALGAQLAEGLAAIHAAGLVHRDLKPSNVILAPDGPRIIDFGIARPAQADGLTTAGVVMGTIEYMSPEQARGDIAGPPSDVYSLAAVLAFAVTGLSPFGFQPADLGTVADQALRDVIAACLTRDPARRPGLDAILAALADVTVTGAAPRAPVGRHAYAGPSREANFAAPPAAAVPPAPVPSVFVPPAGGPPPAVSGPRGGGTAVWADGPVPSAAAPAAQTAQTVNLASGGPTTRWRGPGRRAFLFGGLGVAAAAVGVPAGLKLSGTSARTSVILQRGTNQGSLSVAFSPDGKVLASGNGDGTVLLWDTETMTSKVTIRYPSTDPRFGTPLPGHRSVYGVAFSPDGKTVATVNGDGAVGLWNAASGQPVNVIFSELSGVYKDANGSVAFDPTGQYLVTSYDAPSAEVRHAATGAPIATIPPQAAGAWINAVAFGGDAQTPLLAVASAAAPLQAGSVSLLNIPDGSSALTLTRSNTGLGALAFAGFRLAAVNTDGTVSSWDVAGGSGDNRIFQNAQANARSIAFKPGGSQLMTGNGDGTATIWDWATQEIVTTLDAGASSPIRSVAFSPSPARAGFAAGGTDLVLWT